MLSTLRLAPYGCHRWFCRVPSAICHPVVTTRGPSACRPLVSLLTFRINPPLPYGYYGNAIVSPAAVSTMRKLCKNPLWYALELVKNAKNEATEEYVHSFIDLMAIKGRPYFTRTRSIIVSDFRKFWPRDVDYGWGKSLFNGIVRSNLGEFHGLVVYHPYTNSKGEQGSLVLICLPQEAIERFETELNGILNIKDKDPIILKSNL